MSYANLAGTYIRRAAVRGVQLDDIAARLNTERLLEKMPGTVPGMNASAVLCVRSVSLHVRNKQRYTRSGNSVTGDESRVLGDKMEWLARHAARPILGPVPAQAEAVLFADHAELLCCLASDHVRHLLAHAWWWRVLLPGNNLAEAIAQLWSREAEYVPAALARLAQSNDAVTFVRTLTESESSAITQAMVRSHGLALLAEESTLDLLQAGAQLLVPAKLEQEQKQSLAKVLEKEIHAVLPEVWVPQLSMAQRRVLALGLSVVRMPGVVRSAGYARILPVLLAQADSQISDVDKKEHSFVRGAETQSLPHSSSLPPAGESVNIPSPAGGREWLGPAIQDTLLPRDSSTIEHERPVQSPAKIISPAEHVQSVTATSTVDEHNIASSSAGWRGKGQAEVTDSNNLKNASATNLRTDTQSPQNRYPLYETQSVPAHIDAAWQSQIQQVETQYGGVFFISNAVLALSLYADFTRPLDCGLELSFWDFLALAAVDLGGAKVRKDPLWGLLAQLAGRRTGQPPGIDFEPPSEWRVPGDWLLPFAGDTKEWAWEADAKHLVVRHPAGFVVLDLLRNELAAEVQVRAELAHYDISNFKPDTRKKRSPVTPLTRWRSWVMPYLGHRIASAMGKKHWRRSCREMLNLHGRIECDSERLHVYFSLEQLPVMVRIAGLDRDPGWIPAAGRDLRFYFGCEHA